jgi:hypothetical protein
MFNHDRWMERGAERQEFLESLRRKIFELEEVAGSEDVEFAPALDSFMSFAPSQEERNVILGALLEKATKSRISPFQTTYAMPESTDPDRAWGHKTGE